MEKPAPCRDTGRARSHMAQGLLLILHMRYARRELRKIFGASALSPGRDAPGQCYFAHLYLNVGL